MALTRHAGTWTIEDRCESTWHYLPFEVPAGASALRVELDYDAAGTVLDLGCFGPAGFRGWSGGARRSFVIGALWATPGYLRPGHATRCPPRCRPRRPARRRPTGFLAPGPSRCRRWPATGPAASCRPTTGCAGWRATCTRTPFTPTA